jgi:hypothetical protein
MSEDVVTQETQEVAEVATPAPADTPSVVESPAPEPEKPDTHPLEPGGERFKQVYARTKRAEEQVDQLRGELQREREERIRLEERTKTNTSQQKVYEWPELKAAIDAGQITMDQAVAYREKVLTDQYEKKTTETIDRLLNQRDTVSRVSSDINTYRDHYPELNKQGSDEWNKVAREYQDLVAQFGVPRSKEQELKLERMALIATYGKPEHLTKKPVATRKVDPVMDTASDHRPSNSTEKKDPLKSLTPAQKDHYERMLRRAPNLYPKGWDSVREELQTEYSRVVGR